MARVFLFLKKEEKRYEKKKNFSEDLYVVVLRAVYGSGKCDFSSIYTIAEEWASQCKGNQTGELQWKNSDPERCQYAWNQLVSTVCK